MASRSGNADLELWIAATGLSHEEIARRIAAAAKARGHRQIAPDATHIRRWIDGEKPRPPVPVLLAEVLSDVVKQPLTPGDLGLAAAGPELDSVQLPLLTETAAQALARWTQMDLFMNRRDTLKLAVGAPLILSAERMLGGTARALNTTTKGFDADTVTALEAVTAFFTTADASNGGGLYRSAIVAQLAEVARRIQDGVPKSLKTPVFAATADLAAPAGWVSHDAGRYPVAQRFWIYGIYAAGEAGQRDRGVEIVTRMSHQMIYLGHPVDALGLLGVAAKNAERPATRARVASQTGRVHAALGDERQADTHLGAADETPGRGARRRRPRVGGVLRRGRALRRPCGLSP
ncbi:Tat pathway signal protein [Streptomyces sp. NPDC005132]|uniref:Tat pathway signal protein n=1 Tax=Streptomyces sp. NPDC005132 TaxID=3154294 RepID=UPI0033A3945B